MQHRNLQNSQPKDGGKFFDSIFTFPNPWFFDRSRFCL